MVDSSKLSDAAASAAGQAGEFAVKVKSKITEVAGEVAHRAGPAATQAGERASEIAHKAGTAAAHGVDAAAGGLKSATGGKGAEQIDKVNSMLQRVLDPGSSAGGPTE